VVYVNEGGSFYSLQGWFPLSLCMETLAMAFRKHMGYSVGVLPPRPLRDTPEVVSLYVVCHRD
jgi:hypothetical protein